MHLYTCILEHGYKCNSSVAIYMSQTGLLAALDTIRQTLDVVSCLFLASIPCADKAQHYIK
jgi:hypothetical protein